MQSSSHADMLCCCTSPLLAAQDSAVELLRDIHATLDINTTSADAVATLSSSNTPSNSSAAFIMSLPPFGTVHSPYNFPAAYLPLLQSSRVVRLGFLLLSCCCTLNPNPLITCSAPV